MTNASLWRRNTGTSPFATLPLPGLLFLLFPSLLKESHKAIGHLLHLTPFCPHHHLDTSLQRTLTQLWYTLHGKLRRSPTWSLVLPPPPSMVEVCCQGCSWRWGKVLLLMKLDPKIQAEGFSSWAVISETEPGVQCSWIHSDFHLWSTFRELSHSCLKLWLLQIHYVPLHFT